MAKRANGEGTIRKRSDGRWEGRYYDPIEDKQKSIYGKNQKEVREKLDRIAVDKDVGKFVSSNDITLDEWFEFYIGSYKEGYIKPQSLSAIRSCYKNHIQNHIGSKKIQAITEFDIRRLYQSENSKCSCGTMGQIQIHLKSILSQAEKDKLIMSSPAKDIKLPNNERGTAKRRELTEYELYWFFRGLWKVDIMIFYISYYC